MLQILLICAVMLVGCQRLRLEVDDLRLRCGADAGLEEMEQWIQVATDYGKPNPASISAVIINEELQTQKLPVSSRGCFGKPKLAKNDKWLSVRVEEAGVFGKVLALNGQIPWRIQLSRVSEDSLRIDCAKLETIGPSNTRDIYTFTIKTPGDFDQERFFFDAKLMDKVRSEVIAGGYSLSGIEADEVQLDLRGLKDGNYTAELQIHQLLNFQSGVKSVTRLCNVNVDRSQPVIQLLGRNGEALADSSIRAAPGEAIEFKVLDQSAVQTFSCFKPNSKPDQACKDFSETGTKITAPAEGEWILSLYSIDAAGNKSQSREFELTVFDSEKLRVIAGWLEEARLYINQKAYLQAVFRLAQGIHGFQSLKADAEKSEIRAKIVAPLLQSLSKIVPYARFAADGASVHGLFPMKGDRFAIVSGSIFRADETELKLMRTNGELIRALKYEDRVSIFHNAIDQRLLVIQDGGTYQVLDSQLQMIEEGARSEFPVNQFDRVPPLDNTAGRTHVYTRNGEAFALDLTNAQVTRLADGVEGIVLANSGEWAAVLLGQEYGIYSRASQMVKRLNAGFEVKGAVLAHRADVVCFTGSSRIICASWKELFEEGKFFLESDQAGKAIGISPDGRKIGFAGADSLSLFDRESGTRAGKAFFGPVVQIFFDQDGIMLVDTLIGRRSWNEIYDGMDGSTTTQLPTLTRNQYWFGRTSIFVNKLKETTERKSSLLDTLTYSPSVP